MRIFIRASGFIFPRKQAEDMTAPETFATASKATLDHGAPSRHALSAPVRARYGDWGEEQCGSSSGPAGSYFPRKQAEDMTAPETFATASKATLTTGRLQTGQVTQFPIIALAGARSSAGAPKAVNLLPNFPSLHSRQGRHSPAGVTVHQLPLQRLAVAPASEK